jgi:hypothetical protein
MQIVENWANVQGDVLAYLPATHPNGFIVARVAVRSVHPFEAFPNLFERDVGKVIEVHCSPSSNAPDGLPPVGSPIHWRIRKAAPTIAFAHPDTFAISECTARSVTVP